MLFTEEQLGKMNAKHAVVSLSGGMDSSVLLFMAAERGYEEIHTVTFDYGQRHRRDLARDGCESGLGRHHPMAAGRTTQRNG